MGIKDKKIGMIYRNQTEENDEVLCNFLVSPVKVQTILNGSEVLTKKIVLKVTYDNQDTMITVDIQKLNDLEKLIVNQVLGTAVYCDVSRAGAKLVELVRMELGNVPCEVRQMKPGWSRYHEQMIFAHDARRPSQDIPIMETGKSILLDQSYIGKELETLKLLLSLGPIEVMAPLLAVAFLGPLYEVLRAANPAYAPQFALFINGRSGSFKTAVAKVLFNFYNADIPMVPASFKDTVTSLEKRLAEYACVPVLIDDFYATGLSRERWTMQKCLETVIRYVGDGIGKNRSNAALQDIKGIRPTGMVVITGEDTAGQLSTLLRCLIVNVDRGTFKADTLTTLQKNPLRWSTFINQFVQYCEENFDRIVQKIPVAYDVNRVCVDMNMRLEERRPREQLVQCRLAFDILQDFLEATTGKSKELDQLISDCLTGCNSALKNSQNYARKNSAEEQFCYAFAEAVASKQIIIAESKNFYEGSQNRYDGFADKEFFYFRSASAYAKIRRIFADQGRELSLNAINAKRAMESAGLLVTDIEKQGSANEKKNLEVKVTIGTSRQRMMKVYRSMLESYIDQKY